MGICSKLPGSKAVSSHTHSKTMPARPYIYRRLETPPTSAISHQSFSSAFICVYLWLGISVEPADVFDLEGDGGLGEEAEELPAVGFLHEAGVEDCHYTSI